MNFFKVILIALGTLSLCIGIIGIVVPGLPSTPFILLTAGLYIKSSDRLYQKLTANRFIGSYISCLFFISPLALKLGILIIGFIGTLVMGFIVPTVNISKSRNSLNS